MASNKGGAPGGNQNAAKGKQWTEALRYALLNYEKDSVKRGKALKTIAKKVVEKAIDGEKDAWQEIGNRLDGKPAQTIQGTGEDGDIPVSVKVLFVESTKG